MLKMVMILFLSLVSVPLAYAINETNETDIPPSTRDNYILRTTADAYTDTVIYNDGMAEMKIYSTQRNIFEDNEWKRIEDADSLKTLFRWDIDLDSNYPLRIIDYNMDHIDLCLQSRILGNIPLKIFHYEPVTPLEYIEEHEEEVLQCLSLTDNIEDCISNTKQVIDTEISVSSLSLSENCLTLEYDNIYGKNIEWGLTSTIVTISAGETGSPSDGYIGFAVGNNTGTDVGQAQWDQCHDSLTGMQPHSSNFSNSVWVWAEHANWGAIYWHVIARAFFSFNTSSIPDYANITAATLTFNVNQETSTSTYRLVKSNQTYHENVTFPDFPNCGAVDDPTAIATDIPISTIGVKTFTLNSIGIDSLNKSDFTKLGIREVNYDAEDDMPPLGTTQIIYIDSTESGNPPYLTIYYDINTSILVESINPPNNTLNISSTIPDLYFNLTSSVYDVYKCHLWMDNGTPVSYLNSTSPLFQEDWQESLLFYYDFNGDGAMPINSNWAVSDSGSGQTTNFTDSSKEIFNQSLGVPGGNDPRVQACNVNTVSYNDFTISFWMKPHHANGIRHGLFMGDANCNFNTNQEIGMVNYANGSLQIQVDGAGKVCANTTCNISIYADKWVHFAGVWKRDMAASGSGYNVTLYFNNTNKFNVSITGTVNTVSFDSLEIGNEVPDFSQAFDGWIDDWAFFNTTLTKENISSIYYSSGRVFYNNTENTVKPNISLANDEYLWWINCSDGFQTNITEKRNISIYEGCGCYNSSDCNIDCSKNCNILESYDCGGKNITFFGSSTTNIYGSINNSRYKFIQDGCTVICHRCLLS